MRCNHCGEIGDTCPGSGNFQACKDNNGTRGDLEAIWNEVRADAADATTDGMLEGRLEWKQVGHSGSGLIQNQFQGTGRGRLAASDLKDQQVL